MDERGEPVLSVHGLERHMSDGERETRVAIRSLLFWPGKAYAISGPSGIGKTTALEMLSLAVIPEVVGSMHLCVSDERIDLGALLKARDHRRITAVRGRLFGYVVQTNRLLPFLTVRENVRLSQSIAGIVDEEIIDRLLDRLRIGNLARAYPADLSGGQRQRVGIARGLAHRPRVVLADEPTSAIDHELAALVVGTLVEYARATGATVLIISHNAALVDSMPVERVSIESRVANGQLRTILSNVTPLDGSFGPPLAAMPGSTR